MIDGLVSLGRSVTRTNRGDLPALNGNPAAFQRFLWRYDGAAQQ